MIVSVFYPGDPVLECKPTPHPDAIASGTCPSPSGEGPTEPLPTGVVPTVTVSPDVSATLTTSVPTDSPDTATSSGVDAPGGSDSLPITGAGSDMVVLGTVFLIVGVVVLTVVKLRGRSPKTY